MSFTLLVGHYCNHVDSDVHPNGTRFWATTNHPDKDHFNLVIQRQAPNGPVQVIRTFVQGVDLIGEVGYCSIKCEPSGSLLISLTGAIFKDKEIVSAFTTIPNVAPAFGTPGAAPIPIVTPQPTAVTTTDDVARGKAQQALDLANTAIAQARTVSKAIDALPAPPTPVSDAHIGAIAFQKANDAIFAAASNPAAGPLAHDGLKRYIKGLAQTVLLEAIAYATTATAKQSRLRALIESIKATSASS